MELIRDLTHYIVNCPFRNAPRSRLSQRSQRSRLGFRFVAISSGSSVRTSSAMNPMRQVAHLAGRILCRLGSVKAARRATTSDNFVSFAFCRPSAIISSVIGHRESGHEKMTTLYLDMNTYKALIESLGYADATRFLVQINPGQGDYLEWQDRIFRDVDVNELYEQAQQHWQRRSERAS